MTRLKGGVNSVALIKTGTSTLTLEQQLRMAGTEIAAQPVKNKIKRDNQKDGGQWSNYSVMGW